MVEQGARDGLLAAFSPPAQGNDKTVTNPSSSSSSTCPRFEALTPPGTGATALANAYYTGTAGDPNAPLQNYWSLASQYTLADNSFQGVYGPPTPAAQYLVAPTNNLPDYPNPNRCTAQHSHATTRPPHH